LAHFKPHYFSNFYGDWTPRPVDRRYLRAFELLGMVSVRHKLSRKNLIHFWETSRIFYCRFNRLLIFRDDDLSSNFSNTGGNRRRMTGSGSMTVQ